MPWNWQLPDWPHFKYDPSLITKKEKRFFLNFGHSSAFLKTINKDEYQKFVIEILNTEGLKSSQIEGEILDRESLQSSIKQHFGLKDAKKKQRNKESRMAAALCDVYETYDQPLTHEMLFKWHLKLFEGEPIEVGNYRTHEEPMQIVSHRYDKQKVFFEAPSSKSVFKEMSAFIDWYNSIDDSSILGKVSIAHVYFESIHPFEDGNGRIGRFLVEKALCQEVNKPVLISVSKTLEEKKKQYYSALERCNRTLTIDHWVDFFSDMILQAQEDSMNLLVFLIEKSKMLKRLEGQINQRQEKVLLRLFKEGPNGFKGGLSAENYIAITKTTRATATRDLADLVEKGALVKKGQLRHTRYFLKT